MPLPTPNLDDRSFQDLVDEAKRMIPRYCPEWTDHNVSDPGVTLIELFAWMVDILLFRLNRVPEKSQITFLELMGIKLQSAQPARVPLTFWLSTPAEEQVTLPRGIQAGTEQTATELAITFTTDAELVIVPPELIACYTSPNERVFDDQVWKLNDEQQAFMVFSPRPRPGDALYLGFARNISQLILSLIIDSSIEGIGVDPSHPPLAWEVWTSTGWQLLDATALERDGTGGFNQQGEIILHLPPAAEQQTIADTPGWWLRCLYVEPAADQSGYTAAPVIRSITARAWGGTVQATHSVEILAPVLGRSTGTPGQRFQLDYTPVLRRRADECIEVQQPDGSWEAWEERETFALSTPNERHYTIDDVSGSVIFGPAIREPQGTTHQYGAIPPRDGLIRMTRYRSGGGVGGNVGSSTIHVLQSAVPYVDRVINRLPATGGRDAESIEHAALRAPQVLKTRFRAVTVEDYEHLAQESSPDVARVLCIQPTFDQTPAAGPQPGVVHVYVVPMLDHVDQRLTPAQLHLTPHLITQIRDYLDQRRLLTTRLEIHEPTYQQVQVYVQARVGMLVGAETIKRDIERALYRYLHPLWGGADGRGWPFGRTLYAAELYALLQSIPHIQYVEDVQLTTTTAERVSMVELPAYGLFVSHEHQVSVRQ